MPQSQIQPGRLAILSDEECWDLLRPQRVGRIAWSGIQGVSVVPVNFVVAEGAILLRTTAYSLLARDATDREVAFEVDQVDPERHDGWSVLARGRCLREQQQVARPEPWVTGPRHLGLRIDVRSISGRRILPSPAGRAPADAENNEPDQSGVCFTA